jgi:PAS domain S-box-containing protein
MDSSTGSGGEEGGKLMKGEAPMAGEVNREQTTGSLTASEAWLRALLEAAVDAIISIDERGVIQLVNPAAERLFGYFAQDLAGKNVSVLMPPPDRDEHDPDLVGDLAMGWKQVIGIAREVVGSRKDGTTFPLEISVAEARLGDSRVFVGILRDITERKRTEERFRLVVESTPNAIVMVDAAGLIVLVNSQTEKFFGYRREELVGQPVEILVPERFRGRHPDHRASFFATPSARPMGAGRDLYGRRKDGSEFPVEIGLTPVQTNEGLLVLSAIVDITERKRAEEELRYSHEELERLVAELRAKSDDVRTMTQQLWQAAKLASVGELAASIAHELNNPLATVSLRIESLLGHTPEGDPRRRPLEIIDQETKRMGSLVANLLQFSRRGRDQISTVDIRQELAGAVELVGYHLRKRQIAVVQELAADTPTIHAERQKLRQVFLNLLTNASDAMPQGGTLTLRSRPDTLASGQPAVRIEISDTGTGIPPAHLAKVFDPFFTTKEEGQGTGLGLAICRRVVEEHHGTIQIESEPGQGTTVRIVLPVRNGSNGERIRGAGPAASGSPGERPPRTRRKGKSIEKE